MFPIFLSHFFLTVSCFSPHFPHIFPYVLLPIILPAFSWGNPPPELHPGVASSCSRSTSKASNSIARSSATSCSFPHAVAAENIWKPSSGDLKKIGDALWMIELEQMLNSVQKYGQMMSNGFQMAELLQHPCNMVRSRRQESGDLSAIFGDFAIRAWSKVLGLWGARILKRQPSLRSRLWVTVAWMSSAPLTVWARNQGRPKEDSEVCTDLWTSDIFSWFTFDSLYNYIGISRMWKWTKHGIWVTPCYTY